VLGRARHWSSAPTLLRRKSLVMDCRKERSTMIANIVFQFPVHLPPWVDAKQVNDVIRRPGIATWRWTQRSVNIKWPNSGVLFKDVLFTFYASKTVVKRLYTTDAQKTDANAWITRRRVGGNTENASKVNFLST
jgi:hypothetical protein